MLKVFLVEDEVIIREGIKKNIDWAGNGYDFCGEASDGELAYPMIMKIKPDIVITDIKMPFMDGLKLSRLIKELMPSVEIIILSGYEEFEYAKEAIKLGVAQFLSKPISGDELLKEVNQVAAKINEKKKEDEIKLIYEKEMAESQQTERKNLFQHLVSGEKSMSELLDISKELGISLSAMWYNIILLSIEATNHSNREFSNNRLKAENELAMYEDEHIIVFDRNLEGKALLIKGDSPEEISDIAEKYLDYLKNVASKYDNIRYYAGIGTPVCRMGELMNSYKSAGHAFAHRFFDNESRIVKSDNLNNADTQGLLKNEIKVGDIDSKLFDRNKIRSFLKSGERSEITYFLDEFFDSLGANALSSNIFRGYILMDIYFCVTEFVEELSYKKDEIKPVDEQFNQGADLEGLIGYCADIIDKAIMLRDNAASNRYGDIVESILSYIDENYADDELSLNSVASYVKFSPSHLSMIFSQETGHTFIKYLTDYRMNKAKELLKCSSKRSSEIALEVGYKDPHYFSYLFKKLTGETPTQYRGKKDGTSDI